MFKTKKITNNYGKIVNVYIVYETVSYSSWSNDYTLRNCLFGAVSLTKNADIDKCKCSGYGIGFDKRRFFSHPSGGTGRIINIFGVDISSPTEIDNRKKDILFLINILIGKGPAQGLEHTLSAEKIYSINFTENNKKCCLSLHYDGANSYLSVNGREIHKFKAKDSKIVGTPLSLGNISKDWSVDGMVKAGLRGYVYDFSVDYDAITLFHQIFNEKNMR